MPNELLGAVLLALFSRFSNGSFMLPLRYTRLWHWENTWLVFSFLSQLVLPSLTAWLAVPHLFAVIRQCPLSFLLTSVVSGLIWGAAQVLYGLGLSMLGIAVGNREISVRAWLFA